MHSPRKRPRIAVLWWRLTGYVAAGISALSHEAEVLVVTAPAEADAPFRYNELVPDGVQVVIPTTWLPNSDEISSILGRFQPDAVLCCGWHIPGYRRALASARRKEFRRILFFDNQWMGTLRQWFGVGIAPWYLRDAFDVAFVPGARQAAFARRLGFAPDSIVEGALTYDDVLFSSPRNHTSSPGDERFLFVGRLAAEKGLDVLVRAYSLYRSRSQNPWALSVVGNGPESSRISGREGIDVLPFRQPAELPTLFRSADCFVLPSRFEPWGVVVAEACASGLPVILSSACGAADHLLDIGRNGLGFPSEDHAALADCLATVSTMSLEERTQWGRRSSALAHEFRPSVWAEKLLGLVGTDVGPCDQ